MAAAMPSGRCCRSAMSGNRSHGIVYLRIRCPAQYSGFYAAIVYPPCSARWQATRLITPDCKSQQAAEAMQIREKGPESPG